MKSGLNVPFSWWASISWYSFSTCHCCKWCPIVWFKLDCVEYFTIQYSFCLPSHYHSSLLWRFLFSAGVGGIASAELCRLYSALYNIIIAGVEAAFFNVEQKWTSAFYSLSYRTKLHFKYLTYQDKTLNIHTWIRNYTHTSVWVTPSPDRLVVTSLSRHTSWPEPNAAWLCSTHCPATRRSHQSLTQTHELHTSGRQRAACMWGWHC